MVAAAMSRYCYLNEPFLGRKLHQQISVGIYQSRSSCMCHSSFTVVGMLQPAFHMSDQ